MLDPDRTEVEAHFGRWRAAVDRRDLAAMAPMLSMDARGGNTVFGLFEGREAVLAFMDHWPESVPNRSVWHAIDGARVVNKWRETLPGISPEGGNYDYFGISEFIYAGGGQWNFMYGMPDSIGLTRLYEQWRKDGQAEKYGEVYPGM